MILLVGKGIPLSNAGESLAGPKYFELYARSCSDTCDGVPHPLLPILRPRTAVQGHYDLAVRSLSDSYV